MSSTFVIVDDCESDRYLARRTIRECGFEGEIVEMADGHEFLEVLTAPDKLEHFRESTVDPYIVILDINMPRVDGFEVAEALAQWEVENGRKCWFVVMMLTSSAHPRDMERAERSAIIREFATKPLDAEKLDLIMKHVPAE